MHTVLYSYRAISLAFVAIAIVGTAVDEVGKYMEKSETQSDEKKEKIKQSKIQHHKIMSFDPTCVEAGWFSYFLDRLTSSRQ